MGEDLHQRHVDKGSPCRYRRRGFCVLQPVSVLLFALGVTCYASAQSFPQLTRLYQVQEAQADFIFVIDTSRSMQPFFNRVRAACVDFLRSLPPDDRVFLIRFARTAQLLTSEGASVREMPRIDPLIPRTPSPSPEGDWTDIGRALEEVVSVLTRPDARSLACLVFLTDGEHNPPSDSAFARNTGTGSWLSLKQKASEAVQGKQFFRAYGIGLQKRTDIVLLSEVFGSPYCTALPSSPQQLRVTLDSIKRELLRERLRVLVEEELGRDVLRWEKEPSTLVRTLRRGEPLLLRYRLSSGFAVLPTRWQITGEHQLECTPPIEGIDSSSLSAFSQVTPFEGILSPGQSVEVQVQLVLPPRDTSRLKIASRTTHTLRVLLPHTVHAEPRGEIEQLPLSPMVKVVSAQGDELSAAFEDRVQVVVEEGVSLGTLLVCWLFVLLPFLLLAFVLWYFAPTPFGYLVVQPRRSYPLKGQAKAKMRWLWQLLFICALVVVLAAGGALGGFLAGSWLTYYLGTAIGGLVGFVVGWQRWGRKEVRVGGTPACDIYLSEVGSTLHFFARHGQVYYYTAGARETKPLFDGSEVVLTGVRAVWRERYS